MYLGERRLANFREPPLRDRAYLDSFRDRACDACGALDGTVVAAHIRTGEHAGKGVKRGGDDTLFAVVEGTVTFYQGFKGRKFVSVV